MPQYTNPHHDAKSLITIHLQTAQAFPPAVDNPWDVPQPSNNETPPASLDGPPVIEVVPDPPPQPDDETKDDASNPGDDSDPEHEVDIPVPT